MLCPKCHSPSTRCWDETSIQWWTPDGWPSGNQVAASMACDQCGYFWVELDPPDEAMGHDGNYPDESDLARVFS